ncbi:helix-turn-helix transcriptional regulator [Sediminibacterium sp.]|uniref:helix-turn-helix domain-containing protein n=1 Tax=Sediminibacterium sp. TaxID=1917865 RepID=UPI0025D883B9|nr:helix-turn-helix transcriptional regulator [Sediminibacterium sp.]MBW0176672.1 helix-turn-helix domain-containing protein [Sediminibacterium sp.]
MDLKTKVGKRITQLRKKKSLSQEKFSYEADMERTYLTHIENGRKNISLSTLDKILKALEISSKDFFDSKEFK